jgi:GR25 family glycosyltransferase involved in LPS biosynthesis
MLDLRRYFGGAFVLNLDIRPDRLERFQKGLAAANLTGVTRTRAVEGDKCPHPAWWRAGNGAWGLLMTYARLAQDCLMDGLSSFLVFEDDACFAPDFSERLPGIMDSLVGVEWDMLYLGGQHLSQEAGPPWPFRKEIVRCRNVNRTHAFAVNARFMQKFHQHILHFPDYMDRYVAPVPPDADGKGEVKEWMAHVDHQLGFLHERREHLILAANPWLCGQAGGASNITGSEKDEEWWHDSLGWYR